MSELYGELAVIAQQPQAQQVSAAIQPRVEHLLGSTQHVQIQWGRKWKCVHTITATIVAHVPSTAILHGSTISKKNINVAHKEDFQRIEL